MRKILYLVLLIVLWPAMAKAGVCPTGASYLNPANPTGSLVTLSSLGVTNCYFVAANGSDSNLGTSEASPWLHAPGMANCASNCSSSVLGPGVGIIFRGGDTWHFGNSGASPYAGVVSGCSINNTVPAGLCISGINGTLANPIYYGVDLSWFSGGSWTRPILSADNSFCNAGTVGSLPDGATCTQWTDKYNQTGYYVSSCPYQIGSANDLVDVGFSKYIILDNFEMSGLCQIHTTQGAPNASPPTGDTYVRYGAAQAPLTFERLYLHGSSHLQFAGYVSQGVCAGGTNGVVCANLASFQGSVNNGTVGETVQFNVLDYSDSDPIINTCFGGFYNVAWNVFRYTSSCVTGNLHTFHDNLYEYFFEAGHSNLSESGNYTDVAPVSVIYNNVFRHIENTVTSGGGVGLWYFPQVGATDYIFNNLMYDVGNNEYINIGNGGTNTGNYTFFNNTWQTNVSQPVYRCELLQGGLMTTVNNQIIDDASSYFTSANCNGQLAANTAPYFTSNATANSQGYTSSQTYAYSPIASNSPTVKAGNAVYENYCIAINNAGLTAAYNACLQDTTYAVGYNTTNHTVIPNVRTPIIRQGTPSIGDYEFAAAAPSSTVNWTTTHQTIGGFGVADHGNGQPALSSAQQTTLFSPTSGVGLSLLRVGTPEDGSCTTINTTCANNVYNGDGATGNLSDATACVSNGCRVIASSWTPPASMKTNGNINCTGGSGNGALITGDYGAFATYLSNYIASLQQYASISLYAISPQNEPNTCLSYDSAVWTDTQLDTFIKTNLGPTLAANGQSGVKIFMPEPAWYNLTTYADTCMADSACKAYVSGVAYHDYETSQPTYSNPYSVPLWQTETSDAPSYGRQTCPGYVWCPGISDALVWAQEIHQNMIAGAQVWLWWNTQQSCAGSPWQCNSGLYGSDNATLATRAYAIGNWSKFVRPGWTRIDSTTAPQAGVSVTAFYSSSAPGASFAIVAVNANSSATAQAFTLTNFPSAGVSGNIVTPYVTSSTQNLVQQATTPVVSGVITYTLPANSVTTFTGIIATTGVPVVNLAPSALNFGNQNINIQSSGLLINLQNVGTANLVVTNATANGVFAIVSGGSCVGTSFTLIAGSNCSFNIAATPAVTGVANGTFTLTDNASGSPQTVSLTVNGTQPILAWSPASYAYGNVQVNVPVVSATWTLTNSGTGPAIINLAFGGQSPAGSNFAITAGSSTCPPGGNLLPGTNCYLTGTFTPTAVTAYTVNLIETDVPDGISLNLPITGSGVANTFVTIPFPW